MALGELPIPPPYSQGTGLVFPDRRSTFKIAEKDNLQFLDVNDCKNTFKILENCSKNLQKLRESLRIFQNASKSL
jgi:hypothetical protein